MMPPEEYAVGIPARARTWDFWNIGVRWWFKFFQSLKQEMVRWLRHITTTMTLHGRTLLNNVYVLSDRWCMMITRASTSLGHVMAPSTSTTTTPSLYYDLKQRRKRQASTRWKEPCRNRIGDVSVKFFYVLLLLMNIVLSPLPS